MLGMFIAFIFATILEILGVIALTQPAHLHTMRRALMGVGAIGFGLILDASLIVTLFA